MENDKCPRVKYTSPFFHAYPSPAITFGFIFRERSIPEVYFVCITIYNIYILCSSLCVLCIIFTVRTHCGS